MPRSALPYRLIARSCAPRQALAMVVLLAVAAPLAAADKLADEITAVVGAPEFKQAHWGILLVDLKTGDTVYERNADELFAPASCTKLFSVAAALDALGVEHRFETPVYRRGPLDAKGV